MRYDPISTAFVAIGLVTAARWFVDVASRIAHQFRAPRARVGMIQLALPAAEDQLPAPDLRPQAGEVWS